MMWKARELDLKVYVIFKKKFPLSKEKKKQKEEKEILRVTQM